MDVSRSGYAREHVSQIKQHLDHTLEHRKAGARSAEDPRAQAVFETGAEVLQGYRTAIEHFEQRSEEAWR